MRKYFFIAIILSASWYTVSAQYRESQNLWHQLVWDDEKLNLFVDTRIDFQDLVNRHAEDGRSFRAQTFRIWLVGEIVPGIRYRVRHRLNKNGVILRDNYSGATDHAWLAFDIGRTWTITVGKQSVMIGTFENDYNGADVYQGSMVFNDFDGSLTGVNVAYKTGRQVFNFQVTNSDEPQFASEEYANKALAFNFLWVGDLFNETIRTRWGYGTFQHSRNKFYNWVTIGTQFNIGKTITEVDYYTGIRNMDYGYMLNTDTLGYRYVQDQSLSVRIEYDMGRWKPFIKGIWDKRFDKWFDSTAYRSLGIEAVAEFYPFTGERTRDLRFHACYGYKNTDFRGEFGNLRNAETHTFLIGTRWMFKAK
ncbi:MAG: OprO/OprP family phosphate-selective porin [Tannerellaceae bacterium]|nr:OprO/OprP family phosphate-selective porin [Tannerellaceae bacterium]